MTSASPHQEMHGVRGTNLVLRFVLELAALAALAFWGFHTGRTLVTDVLLGVGTPLLAAIVWGRYAAPRSPRRLRGGSLVAVQMAVFAAGVAALTASGQPLLAAVFAALVVANAVLMHLWRQNEVTS